uniref:Uncharacterized protein n=1 Tax=Rhizophagus irregularis (strain DAOM 181602 / DAOM 197198 / MUCL 43194) TaxID=747089 RepID=U9TA28_RHIID
MIFQNDVLVVFRYRIIDGPLISHLHLINATAKQVFSTTKRHEDISGSIPRD